MKILQSLLYGLALAGPQQDDTEEMCGGVSRISKKKSTKKSNFKNRIWLEFLKTTISEIDFETRIFVRNFFGSVFSLWAFQSNFSEKIAFDQNCQKWSFEKSTENTFDFTLKNIEPKSQFSKKMVQKSIPEI